MCLGATNAGYRPPLRVKTEGEPVCAMMRAARPTNHGGEVFVKKNNQALKAGLPTNPLTKNQILPGTKMDTSGQTSSKHTHEQCLTCPSRRIGPSTTFFDGPRERVTRRKTQSEGIEPWEKRPKKPRPFPHPKRPHYACYQYNRHPCTQHPALTVRKVVITAECVILVQMQRAAFAPALGEAHGRPWGENEL